MNYQNHAGLSGYMMRNQIVPEAARSDGALVLMFDKKYRVYCRPAPRGDLVLEARLIEMPDEPAKTDALIKQALQVAGGRLYTDADALVLSDDESKLFLQQRIAADSSTDEFEIGLEQFVNAVAVWRQVLCEF
jgi:hypothetical protein